MKIESYSSGIKAANKAVEALIKAGMNYVIAEMIFLIFTNMKYDLVLVSKSSNNYD